MNCTNCDSPMPDGSAFRFCPFCGAALSAPTAKKSAPSGTDPYSASVPAITASEAATNPDLAPLPDMSDPDVLHSAQDTVVGASPVDDPNEAPTRAELPALDEATIAASLQSGDSDTVEELPAVRATAARAKVTRRKTPAKAPAAAKKGPTDKRAKKPPATDAGSGKPEFSETAWFLAAVSPEQLAETEGEATDFAEQELMTERYAPEERLPNDIRRSFSLEAARRKLTLEQADAVDPDDIAD